MKTKVILNPYANRWRAKERIPEVQAALQAAGIEYDLVVTEAPRHAIELAAQASREGFDAVIAAGGDGTISEVVNGMARARLAEGEDRLDLPLGVLPLGSANDFSVNLGLPLDLGKAAAGFLSGKRRWIDLGVVSYCRPGDGDAGAKPFCYFDNNSAMGLEPTITLIQQRITWLHGTPRYLLATLIGILKNVHWDAELEWEGGSYKGPVTLVTVGNNPLTGGLFYMTPHADPGDGRLTFVYAYLSTRLKVLNILPRTMKPGAGSYVEHPAAHEVHSPWLRIRCTQPTPLHADGEIQHEAVQEIEYRILPGRLGVLG
jgi:diacylglycerol kinase (ATP)